MIQLVCIVIIVVVSTPIFSYIHNDFKNIIVTVYTTVPFRFRFRITYLLLINIFLD